MSGISMTSWGIAMERVREILADGEWHDREEVIAEVMPLVDHEEALQSAQIEDYWRERHNRERRQGTEYRKWIAEHPTPEDYDPGELSAERGARRGLMVRIGRDRHIETLRSRQRGGAGLTMLRKGGEAAL